MKISFACPGCGKTFHKTNCLGGNRAVCRACRREFLVPDPTGPDHPFPPDDLRFLCPSCGEIYHKDNTLTGQRARCTGCQAVFTVPDPDDDDVPYVPPPPVSVPQPSPARIPARAPVPAPQPAAAVASLPRNDAPASPARPPAPEPDDETIGMPIVHEEEHPHGLEFLPEDEDDDQTVRMPAPGFAAGPGSAPVDAELDDEPIVFELIETTEAATSEPQLDPAELVPIEKSQKKAGGDKIEKKKRKTGSGVDRMELVTRFFDRISAMRWTVRRLIVLGCALIGFVAFSPLGAPTRATLWDTVSGWIAWMTGNALDDDDRPDTELDDNPPAVVRPRVLADHEQALDAVAAACDEMNTVIETIVDGPSALAAAPRMEAAAQRLEKVSKTGEMLVKTNRAECARLRERAITRVHGALDRLTSTLARKQKLPGMGESLGTMRAEFAKLGPQLDKEYAAETPRVEIKIRGVTSGEYGQVVMARFDAEIPQSYRRFVGVGIDGNANLMRIKFGPVEDPKEIVRLIKFGKVEKVLGRRIRVAVTPPTDDELAAARAARAAREHPPSARP